MSKLDKPHVYEWEDGSIVMEWIKKNKRFGISFEKDLKESGWFFVSYDECVSEEFSEEMTKYLQKFFEE